MKNTLKFGSRRWANSRPRDQTWPVRGHTTRSPGWAGPISLECWARLDSARALSDRDRLSLNETRPVGGWTRGHAALRACATSGQNGFASDMARKHGAAPVRHHNGSQLHACVLGKCAASAGARRPASKEVLVGTTSLSGCRLSEQEEQGRRKKRATEGRVVAVAGGLDAGEGGRAWKDVRR
jgi:hypothetical protein